MRNRTKLVRLYSEEAAGKETEYNVHYISSSRVFMWIKYILLIVLVVYLVVMLSVYRKSITYDNLSYLIKDFNSDSAFSPDHFAELTFDEQPNMDFASYNGEFAIAGSDRIALYNHSASKTFEYESNMENPILISGSKYLLAYDLGGKNFSVFNSLARVFNSSTDSVIENAAMSESGEFVIVTRSRDSKYTVAYYSSAFENEVNYFKGKFVSSVALSGNGDTVAIATVDMVDGGFTSFFEFYRRGESEVFSEYSAEGILPVALGSFDDGSFFAVCDSTVLFFDKKGSLISEFKSSGENILLYDCFGSHISVFLSEDALRDSGKVLLFDSQGNIGYSVDTEYKVVDVSLGESLLYLLSVDNVYKYDFAGQEYAVSVEECPLGTFYIANMSDFVLLGNKTRVSAAFDS